jgi:hypothetical protein
VVVRVFFGDRGGVGVAGGAGGDGRMSGVLAAAAV